LFIIKGNMDFISFSWEKKVLYGRHSLVAEIKCWRIILIMNNYNRSTYQVLSTILWIIDYLCGECDSYGYNWIVFSFAIDSCKKHKNSLDEFTIWFIIWIPSSMIQRETINELDISIAITIDVFVHTLTCHSCQI
jgi:hypothetical protein